MKRIVIVSLFAAIVSAVLHAQLSAAAQPAAEATAAPTAPLARPSADANYAQYLVGNMLALHPQILEIDVHAIPPGSSQSIIVAAKNAARVGRRSDPDDIAVFRSGEPRVEINRLGDQNAEVEVQLFDIYKQVIGSVEFTFPYPPGTDQDALVRQAAQYRDEMSRRILELTSLFDPVQLDPRIPVHTYAQFLVDDALGRYPGIEVIVLHARTPHTGNEYPIVASNIGRIGKPADVDDLAVITTGEGKHAVDARAARFESKLPLKDASGATVGAVAVIFPYRPLANAGALQAQAEKIAVELRGRITNAAQLEGPYPEARPTEPPD